MNRPVGRLRRRTLALVLASLATLLLTAATFGGSSRYQDYGGDKPNQSDQCALPVQQQQPGGWVCWTPEPSGP